MKKVKREFLGIIAVFALVIMVMPASAFASNVDKEEDMPFIPFISHPVLPETEPNNTIATASLTEDDDTILNVDA